MSTEQKQSKTRENARLIDITNKYEIWLVQLVPKMYRFYFTVTSLVYHT